MELEGVKIWYQVYKFYGSGVQMFNLYVNILIKIYLI